MVNTNGHLSGYDSSPLVSSRGPLLVNKEAFLVSTAESSPEPEKKSYRNQHQKARSDTPTPSLTSYILDLP
jgi:hypothetical protein